jgi:hypothetical protein
VITRILRTAAATLLAAAALTAVQAVPASAQDVIPPLPACPNGERPCVYLRPGTYTLGNPVTTSTGAGPVTQALLNHCNSSGTDCDTTYLLLPGLAVASTSTAILTLNVPGEGVGLDGTTPTLYTGVPSASLGRVSAGLTLNVRGTAFVVYDTLFNDIFACDSQPIAPNPYVNGYASCSYDLTVTV